GNLEIDLAATIEITLMTPRPQKVPTGIRGPIIVQGRTMGALLLGRSSASMLRLFVLPSVIDADFTREIMIIVYTPFPPIKINKRQRITQLVPLEQVTKDISPSKDQIRRESRFRSTGGLILLTLDLSNRPKRRVMIEYKGQQCVLMGLLNTGADSSIVA
ncbi:POK9 protein, partial [Vidua macroura]|nr:POK9 protein [Vidua macroura]